MGVEAWARIVSLPHHDPGELVAELVGFQVTVARPAWQMDAVCAGYGPRLFFPERGESTSAARDLCERCPVRAQCLDYALEHYEYGYWAGTSERERRRMRRQLRRAA